MVGLFFVFKIFINMKHTIKKLLRESLLKESLLDNDIKSLIRDTNVFASFGNPYGFKENKIIGRNTDILDKTVPYEGTDFRIAVTPLGDKKKLSIHFPQIEQTSSRGGGHAGLSFLFDNDVVINKQLVNMLLPAVDDFRSQNFTLNNGVYQINTNNPSEMKPVNL